MHTLKQLFIDKQPEILKLNDNLEMVIKTKTDEIKSPECDYDLTFQDLGDEFGEKMYVYGHQGGLTNKIYFRTTGDTFKGGESEPLVSTIVEHLKPLVCTLLGEGNNWEVEISIQETIGEGRNVVVSKDKPFADKETRYVALVLVMFPLVYNLLSSRN